ncbi:kinase-like domain-containing protein [Rhizophagus clarus]|uniref:Kinase-like domain-containing protein n=1 Tax=Rhizophagus clarus TaxID=94130 RepID=A0A8H3MDH2_9GLOM|nr:kinase-like domain-containing protein [Rhizophagus clarus]
MNNINNKHNDIVFNPTPKLLSSRTPILFITNNWNDRNCFDCNDKYFETPLGGQKYCKKCLLRYIDINIIYDDSYLDVIIRRNLKRSKHICKELIIPNIQEWCKECSEISLFKQLCFTHHSTGEIFKQEKHCNLCKKLVYNKDENRLEACSNCYLITSEWVESILFQRTIPVLYLPWWDDHPNCIACDFQLKSTPRSQKYCTHCYIIYIGCRYCLTTNILFGFTDQSKCKKCERTLLIDLRNICTSSGNRDLDEFLYAPRFNFYDNLELDKIIDHVKQNGKPLDVYKLIRDKYIYIQSEPMMEWIPYSQIVDLNEIERGGCGIIYRATWIDGPMKDRGSFRDKNETVAIKKFKEPKHFLNEIKSNRCCYKFKHHLIRYYGFTKDDESDDYMLVMKFAAGGDLHNFLKNNFADLTWNKQKLHILWQISEGLENIHESDFIHRDIHSGNILLDLNNSELRYQWQIGDLGLTQPENNLLDDEVYGVIPYIAPEIFNCSTFSKKSDVYSMAMIMWEFTTGCKPFANVAHDLELILNIVDGKRPAITEDTPECFANLMKSCWDPDPQKRPSMKKVREIFGSWYFRNKDIKQFNDAETKRKALLYSKNIGPEFTEKRHPEAIYTSRLLQEYITKAYELDINNIPSQDTNGPTNSSRKRKIKELDIENQDNSGKCGKWGEVI